jgi:hypothetical protein
MCLAVPSATSPTKQRSSNRFQQRFDIEQVEIVWVFFQGSFRQRERSLALIHMRFLLVITISGGRRRNL